MANLYIILHFVKSKCTQSSQSREPNPQIQYKFSDYNPQIQYKFGELKRAIYICTHTLATLKIMINRKLNHRILEDFGKGKVIVIIGARQVGKTTLVDSISQDKDRVLKLNCDNSDDRLDIENKSSTELESLMQGYDIVFIDEAQRVSNIGLTIKMMADLKKVRPQIVISGSSSLELAEGIYEPATGRHIDYELFPLCVSELAAHSSPREEKRMLSQRLIYGSYPEVVTNPNDARRLLMTLSSDYLYKDLLGYKGIKKPEILQKLLRALALQVGSEVSYNELSNLVGIDKATVENYINLLEKCYVIFRVESYSSNLRNEIKKGKKIFFWDNGIRNAILANFANPELRSDMGMLWENYIMSERRKMHLYNNDYTRMYFWRTHTQSEIDLIEEHNGQLYSFEMKWNGKAKAKQPSAFATCYPGTPFSVITPENYMDFL